MAQHVEPMDIDSDFDNKENSLHHNNVLPFTEKGYEELDVSELNMKLRYSVTPASSPMSKSYTANCVDNRGLETGEDSLNVTVSENLSLTRSLNANITKNDNTVKSLKALPLQAIPTEQLVDSNRNTSVLRPLESTLTPDNGNITVTVSAPSDIDENLSLPSSSSSALQTPEATTPTKDIPPKDGGSPIMRGLKSVLSMFRSSQSPIPPTENENTVKLEILSPVEEQLATQASKSQVLASTPISARKKEMSPTKRSSPQKDGSIVFSDDLEKELQWKDETTIIFSQERIPIHKLMFQHPQDKILNKDANEVMKQDIQDLNSTVEYMDISYNDSIRDRTVTDIQTSNKQADNTFANESDSEFVDCETTFTRKDAQVVEDNDKTPVINKTQELDLTREIENKNDSGSRLRQIILDTTQDILDATLSVRPEDLLPEDFNQTKDMSEHVLNRTQTTEIAKETTETKLINEECSTLQSNQPVFDQTLNITGPVTETIQNLDATKTFNDTTIVQPIDQTFDVTISEVTSNESLDDTKTEENALSVTKILEDEPNDLENVNKTITNEVNETFDAIVNPVLENIVANTTISNLDNNLTKPLDATYTHEIPVPQVLTPMPATESINEILPIPVEVDNVKVASKTELPIDVPLPDDDDDEEINMSIVTTTEITSPLPSLPLDLVDDIKVGSELTDTNNAVPTANEVIQPVKDEHVVPVEESAFTDISSLQNSQDINNQTIEINTITDEKEVQNTVQLNPNTDSSELCKESEHGLPGINSKSYTIIGKVSESVTEINIDNNDMINTNRNENVDVNKILETIEDVIHNQSVVPMDINESVCEFRPLPDIINQTITMSNAENIESSITHLETIASEAVLEAENNSNKIDPEAVPEVTNEIETQINTSNCEPVTETSNAVEEVESVVPALDTKVEENVSADVTMTCNSENNIVSSDNIANASVTEANRESISNDSQITIENINLNAEFNDNVIESTKSNAVEEEIVLSENNSPFVSVIADDITEVKTEDNANNIENIEDPTNTKVTVTPPSSPPIRSKGYNFNFDDLDFDPFATKTNIRMSPPLDSPNKPPENRPQIKSVEKVAPRKDNNRRKSQPERRRPVAPKRKFNSTFDGTINEKVVETPAAKLDTGPVGDIQLESPTTIALNPNNVKIEEQENKEIIDIPTEIVQELKEISATKLESVSNDKIQQDLESSTKAYESSFESNFNELKATSSSEQSAYYSAGASSSDSSIPSKNVFNLPEIDDVNFNPFATKSKMRQSPPPELDMDNPFVTKSKIKSSPDLSIIVQQHDGDKTTTCEDKIETEPMEKDALSNLSNTTASSKATDDRNVTSRELHTEDEDTIEGPFLEADDSNHDDKLSDFDGENIDMLQFNELPPQSNEDNADNGELFIDAEAFEFLLNQNKSNTVVDSGKESLFLKFDPLFAKRMSAVTSDGVVASLARLQKRQSTPTKAARPPSKNVSSPVAGPSNSNVTQDVDMNNTEEFNDDLNITVSKPMMVVPPAVNPVTPRNKSSTPSRSNRRSITFTSPAMAVIDRLLSLSGNSSMLHDTTMTQVSREQNEADIALSQLRELLAEKEINVYNLRSESNELRDRLNTLESHVKSLETESQDRLKKINQLNDTLAEKTKINRSMAAVVEEYERTIASLIAETAQDKKKHAEERIKLINERDEQTAHLASMEVSFSDLHSKYEKSKQIILNCKANEDTYKKSIKEFEENFTKMQNNYELLKQHATSKLNHANQEMEKINRSHEAEVLKLNAMVKRKELHITSLEESLIQKTKANEELTAICDELINKVG